MADGNEDSLTESSVFFSRPEEAPTSALTTVDVATYTTATVTFAIETIINGVVSTITSTGEVAITNAADYSSILVEENDSDATTATTSRAPEPTQSSTTATTTTTSTSGAPSPAVIAGAVVGVLAALTMIVLLLWYFYRRSHRQVQTTAQSGHGQTADTVPYETAQLHSNDVKPRNELPGSDAPAVLLQRPMIQLSELPANEEVRRTQQQSVVELK
jgi:hypothetical protein